MSGEVLPSVPVSVGELADKITILELKRRHAREERALRNIEKELGLLQAVWDGLDRPAEAAGLVAELRGINGRLWEIEDDIRACEARGRFGEDFVSLARSVYLTNDRRSAVKRKINRVMKSGLVEEKVHPAYAADQDQDKR